MTAEWRRRLAVRPPTADWYRRRHHCYDVVLGSGKKDQKPPRKAVDADGQTGVE